MKTVKSQALGDVARALGLTGTGAGITEFLDGTLEQVVDVAPMVRRGQTLASSQGLFVGLMQNVHAVQDGQLSQINPYEPGAAAIPPYPTTIARDQELWLLAASCARVAGGGTIAAELNVQYQDVAQGFGINQAGTPVVAAAHEIGCAWWDALTTITERAILDQSGVFQKVALRLQRSPGMLLSFRTVSSEAATFNCAMILGLFPISLGQDAIG